MEEITFTIQDFEGPLDLLLALISKNKMNIYDIRIMELIDQYLAVVNQGKDNGIESASEFIEMAARLIYMKSVFLLPRNEEQERLKEELTGLLIEYSACKKIAAQLGEMSKGVYYAVRRPMEVEFDNEYSFRHEAKVLRQAVLAMQGRRATRHEPKQEQFEALVSAPFVSVETRAVHLLRNLIKGKIFRLQAFFSAKSGRSEVVATFLALLELIRNGRVHIDEMENLSLNRQHIRSQSTASDSDT